MDRLAEGVLADGTPAAVDEDGTQWGLILLFGQGDLEQLVLQWGLPSYGSTEEMCGYCLANRSNRPYTNLQENSPWRPTTNLSNEADMDGLLASFHEQHRFCNSHLSLQT